MEGGGVEASSKPDQPAAQSAPSISTTQVNLNNLKYVNFSSEEQLRQMMKIMEKELSEPYSVYTYRYFLYNWPHLCWIVYDGDLMIGAAVSKLERDKKGCNRGYIAMLAVEKPYRKLKIGSELILRTIQSMKDDGCQQVVLETEASNHAALGLYTKLGFLKEKRLQRYYLNGGDAFRLKLWLEVH